MASVFSRHTKLLIGFLIGLASAPCLFAGKEFLAGPGERVIADQLLVGLQPGADINQILVSVAPRAIARMISRERNTYLLRLPAGAQALMSKRLAAHALVNYVEPNRIRQVAVLPPNDPLITQQWALTAIQAVQAWSYFPDQYLTSATASTTRVRVAVLDTGVDCTHPDFMNAGGTSTDSAHGGQISWAASQAIIATTISSPTCAWQDDNGHGTLTAGALAAATNNATGVASLGFPLQLMVFKVIDSTGQALDNEVAQGIEAAISAGAQVISMSIAGSGYSQTLQSAIDSAWQHNILVVAAAGNNTGTLLTYPGDANHVLTVSATDTNNLIAGFSNYGTWIKIAAPGVSIETTWPTYPNSIGLNYGLSSGTSLATSLVSALAGLLYSIKPDLSAAVVAQTIQQTAQTPNPGWDQFIGYGVINAAAALAGTPSAATLGGLTGQVVDGSNNPIAGAVVTAGGQSFNTLVDPTTGTSTGLFRIANLSPGSYAVGVTAPGFSSVTVQVQVVAGADAMLTIPMSVALGRVTGSVTYNGTGVGGATVEAVSGNPGLIQRTAYTDASGAYTMYLPAGTYTFLASAPSFVNASSASQTLGTGLATINLALSAMGNLTGTVVDANGVGVAGAHINFTSSSFSGGDVTGSDGRYSTFGMPSGTYTVSASASGYSNVTTSGVSVTANASTPVNFQFSTGVSLTTGLLGYWPLNDDTGTVARDQSGNGHNANLSNTAWTTGLFSFALSFNGSNSQGITSAIPLTTSFSISAWVNPAVTSQAAFAAIAQVRSTSGLFLGSDSTGTHYKFFVNSGTGSTGSCAFASIGSGCAQGGTVTAGWHLVTGTFDGATGILYVDGVMVANDTFTPPANASLALEIGRSFTSSKAWNGILDDVRLYSRALSAAEVSSLFAQQGSTTFGLTKTADAAAVVAGGSIGFTLAVANNTTTTATSATLTDTLPTGTGINWSISPAYSGPGTCSIASGALSCNFGNLASGASATVHITSATSTASCGQYVNNASASATNATTALSSARSAVQCVSTACTVTGDQTASVADVQAMINEALGVRSATTDINLDGVATVADVQIVINAVLGFGCLF